MCHSSRSCAKAYKLIKNYPSTSSTLMHISVLQYSPIHWWDVIWNDNYDDYEVVLEIPRNKDDQFLWIAN